jgi:diacylglycerol kinase family enzyme
LRSTKLRRLAALASLGLGAVALVLAIVVTVTGFPIALAVLACIAVALLALPMAATVRGARQFAALGVGGLAAAGALALILFEGRPIEDLAIAVSFLLGVACARIAFAPRARLAPAQPPERPVLFFNPLSGGGKAARLNLAAAARSRGIEPIEFHPGEDLVALVRGAVAGGADGLAMAGGDGSQAVVAAIAAEFGLPYACIPAGTRNHFALDLGVDRDDAVGALDAFVDGGERRVDLAEVNGRVFVNNVSLGVYAEAVQRAEYRDAKLRTLLETAPDRLAPEADRPDLSWSGPDRLPEGSPVALLVSNDRYRLGRLIGSGTRPRLDEGVLGVALLTLPEPGIVNGLVGVPWAQWSAGDFEVEADTPLAAGIDGEAASLRPPLRFRSRPRALRVRIAAHHPGASPSAAAPDGIVDGVRCLAAIGLGHAPAASANTIRKEIRT